jgi:hypothetical protein
VAHRARPEVTVTPCANSFALESDPAANDVERKEAVDNPTINAALGSHGHPVKGMEPKK